MLGTGYSNIWLKRRLSVTWKRSVSSKTAKFQQEMAESILAGIGRISLTRGRRWHGVDNAERQG